MQQIQIQRQTAEEINDKQRHHKPQLNDERRNAEDRRNARKRKLNLRDQIRVALENIDSRAENFLNVEPGNKAAHKPEDIGDIGTRLVSTAQPNLEREPEHQDVHRRLREEPQGAKYRARRRFLQIEQPQAQDLLAPLPLFLEYLRERAHDPRFSQPIISEPLFYHCFAAITVPIRDCSTAGDRMVNRRRALNSGSPSCPRSYFALPLAASLSSAIIAATSSS